MTNTQDNLKRETWKQWFFKKTEMNYEVLYFGLCLFILGMIVGKYIWSVI
jgi:hypothetical protein